MTEGKTVSIVDVVERLYDVFIRENFLYQEGSYEKLLKAFYREFPEIGPIIGANIEDGFVKFVYGGVAFRLHRSFDHPWLLASELPHPSVYVHNDVDLAAYIKGISEYGELHG